MKIKKLNKKAVLFEIITMIPRIIFLVIVMFSIIFLIRSAIAYNFSTFDAEANLFTIGAVYSISQIDQDTGMINSGVIDLNEFNSGKLSNILESSINYGADNKKIAAKLTLKDMKNNVLGYLVYNKDYYNEWEVKARAFWNKGPGGVHDKINKIYVLVNDGTKISGGYLEVYIIVPNS
jgi:hypothetical protein